MNTSLLDDATSRLEVHYRLPIIRIVSKSLLLCCLVAGLAACQSTSGGQPQLNSAALGQFKSANAKQSLAVNRKKLVACVMQAAASQKLKSGKIDSEAVSAACAKFETPYRASVMANVRKHWQSKQSVLINTANTSTRNLYSAALGAIQ
ncbi:MAG TPA: hypothetical protein DCS30_13960 [Rhizobiales bacterium]|nr:hypothetical protein [Hyphomicrobiales bacterium]